MSFWPLSKLTVKSLRPRFSRSETRVPGVARACCATRPGHDNGMTNLDSLRFSRARDPVAESRPWSGSLPRQVAHRRRDLLAQLGEHAAQGGHGGRCTPAGRRAGEVRVAAREEIASAEVLDGPVSHEGGLASARGVEAADLDVDLVRW